MSHLPTERLAALVNEPPSASELAHLAASMTSNTNWAVRSRVEDADELARAWTGVGADVRNPEDTEWASAEVS